MKSSHTVAILLFSLIHILHSKGTVHICPKYEGEDLSKRERAILDLTIWRVQKRTPTFVHPSLQAYGGSFSLCLTQEDFEDLKADPEGFEEGILKYVHFQRAKVASSKNTVRVAYPLKTSVGRRGTGYISFTIMCPSSSDRKNYELEEVKKPSKGHHFFLYESYACLSNVTSKNYESLSKQISNKPFFSFGMIIFTVCACVGLILLLAIVLVVYFVIRARKKSKEADSKGAKTDEKKEGKETLKEGKENSEQKPKDEKKKDSEQKPEDEKKKDSEQKPEDEKKEVSQEKPEEKPQQTENQEPPKGDQKQGGEKPKGDQVADEKK